MTERRGSEGGAPTSATARLQLLRLASPALPIGAFAWSEGLESAVELGHVCDEESTARWLEGRLVHGVGRLDAPVLARCHAAWRDDDPETVWRWSRWLIASRESAELRLQDRSLALALARLLVDLGFPEARAWTTAADATHPALFALAAQRWGAAVGAATEAWLFAWCESQVAAAVKLVPLGQTAGQRVLGALLERIPAVVEAALALEDDEVGAAEPGLGILSAWHETQYTRLFRS